MDEQKEDLKKAESWSKHLNNHKPSKRVYKVHWQDILAVYLSFTDHNSVTDCQANSKYDKDSAQGKLLSLQMKQESK